MGFETMQDIKLLYYYIALYLAYFQWMSGHASLINVRALLQRKLEILRFPYCSAFGH